MSQLADSISLLVLEDIMQAFRFRLKVNILMQGLPQFNTRFLKELTLEMVSLVAMPQPANKKVGVEDLDPINISPDINANFSIEFAARDEQPVSPSVIGSKKILADGLRTKRARKQASKHLEHGETDRGVFALSQPILSERESQLQDELGLVKKNLYFMRRLRKESQEEEQRRLEEHMNRKILQLPNQQFAFDFSGQFLFKKKPVLKKSFAILTMGKSQQITQASLRQKRKETQQSDRDYLISREQGGQSRQSKRRIFENLGKRQVSNLPFIKLTENTKLSENSRSMVGPDTSSFTMKSYQSRGQSTFRHFSEIQKEKTLRMYSLKKSSRMSEATEEEVEQEATSSVPKKQSKRMQKYLSKLCEDRNRDFISQINRSCNFQRLNSPHDYSVHRYYRHNFNDDKRSICESSLASLRLNNSYFQQTKAIS